MAEAVPIDVVADEFRTAVPAVLRAINGCPGIDDVARALRDAALYGDEAKWQAAQKTFLDTNGRHTLSLVICRVANGLLGADSDALGSMTDRRVAQDLARVGLEEFVIHEVFSRGRHILVNAFATAPEERAVEREVLGLAGLDETAERLLLHPDGQGLRAPASKLTRLATDQLLNLDLEGDLT